MDEIQERLAIFLKASDLTAKAFEDICGFGNGTCAAISKRSRRKTFDIISKVFPQLNMDWLKTGAGEMLRADLNINLQSNSGGDNQQNNQQSHNNRFENHKIATESKVAILKEKINSLTIQLNAEKDKNKGLQSNLEDLRASISDKDDRIKEYKERIAELKKQINGL